MNTEPIPAAPHSGGQANADGQAQPVGRTPAPGPDPARPAEAQTRGPRPVRSGPIVWGALVLVACAFVAQQVLAPGTLDATAWVTAIVLGLGVLLLVAGIAAVVKQSRRDR